MKAFFAICVVVASLAGICLAKPSNLKEIFIERVKTCQAELGATEGAAALEELKDHSKTPKTDNAKKLLVCAMKGDKLIVDGKFSTEGANALAHQMLEGQPDMEKKAEMAKDIAEKCATEFTEKPPSSVEDLAVSIRRCLLKRWKEAGLTLEDQLEV